MRAWREVVVAVLVAIDEYEISDCMDGGLRNLLRLCGTEFGVEMPPIPRLAFEPMKLMLNDVAIVASVPSRSLLCALGSMARIALDALRISSANLLFWTTTDPRTCSTTCLNPNLGIRNCLGVEGRWGKSEAGAGTGAVGD